MSAATTRSRSSPRPGPVRSTMRYWTVLVSGTRHLGEELFHELARLALVPRALAEHVVADAAARIDEEAHGKAAHFPLLRHLVLGVQQHRQLDAGAREVLVDPVGELPVVHREELERAAGELILQLHQRGQLVLAGLAPRGPEVHEHDAPTQPPEVDGLAVQRGRGERRRGLVAPGLDGGLGRRARRARRRARENERRQPVPRGDHRVHRSYASSLDVMVYLKLSASSESTRALPVSHCGYMRNATVPRVAPGSVTSLPVL